MKKILFCCLALLVITASVNAQVSKDSLLKLMSKETCTEITNKDFSGKNMDELQMELGLAMMPVVLKYQEELQTVFGISGIEDQSGMEKMGMEIGLQLAKDCPAFLKMFVNNPGALKEIVGNNTDAAVMSISGTLLKVVTGDFTYIQIKDASGKTEKLWWMEYFEGSSKLTGAATMVNKQVKAKYIEKEIYNATLKEYIKIKVITGLE